MRFNKKREESDTSFALTPSPSSYQPDTRSQSVNNDNSLIAIDTVRVDEQSRLTLTKRVKQVLPFEAGDKIAVYQDKINPNTVICSVQRRNEIVERLTITKNVIVGATTNIDTISNIRHDRTLFSNRNHNDQRPARILIVDDEQDTLITFKAALSPDSTGKEYDVEAFTDAQEALKRFLEVKNNNKNNRSFDLVITDIRMNGLNGVQLYQILNALEPTIKVLFISGLDTAQEIISVLTNVNSNDIIRKPIGAEDLVKIIGNALSYSTL